MTIELDSYISMMRLFSYICHLALYATTTWSTSGPVLSVILNTSTTDHSYPWYPLWYCLIVYYSISVLMVHATSTWKEEKLDLVVFTVFPIYIQ